jgi:hypothetical protein
VIIKTASYTSLALSREVEQTSLRIEGRQCRVIHARRLRTLSSHPVIQGPSLSAFPGVRPVPGRWVGGLSEASDFCRCSLIEGSGFGEVSQN